MFSSQVSMYSLLKTGPLKITILGNGNWGCAVARVVALNTKESYLFDDTVTMWTYEEVLADGRKLSEIINETHENVKYLPGVILPNNLVAVTDVVEAAKDADLICVVLPHQFIRGICEALAGKIKPSARAINFAKGLDIKDGIPRLLSSLISEILEVSCDALSGANVAKDVAADQFCEATVGYSNPEMASIWQHLFDRPTFRIFAVPDIAGVQICGALKNVVAMAAGFCDGMKLGTNTKSAIIRIGFEEIRLFASIFFSGILEDTYYESAGMADMITTCFGGRNVRCAAEFVLRGPGATWPDVERDILNGQKMQGQLACKEVHEVLEHFNTAHLFPLFVQCHEIAFKSASPQTLLSKFMERPIAGVKSPKECTFMRIHPEIAPIRANVIQIIERRTTSKSLSDECHPDHRATNAIEPAA